MMFRESLANTSASQAGANLRPLCAEQRFFRIFQYPSNFKTEHFHVSSDEARRKWNEKTDNGTAPARTGSGMN
jgi:hypothetical protein